VTHGLRVLADWDLTDAERAVIARSWPAAAVVTEGSGRPSSDLADIGVLVCGGGNVDAATVRAAAALQLVHLLGHGVDGLYRDGVAALLSARSIRIATTDAAAIAIAEFVVGALVALARRLFPVQHALVTRGEWAVERTGRELCGATLCVVGLGAVGRAVVERGRALGMIVGGVTRRPALHGDIDLAFRYPLVEIESALAVADHVVLALPITPETDGLIDAVRIAVMRPGACLVNVGRGGLVDEVAMAAALRSGALGGAAIDTWTAERGRGQRGYPAEDQGLHELNVIMTPHFAGKTRGTRRRALERVGENLRRLAAGEALLNEVRPTADLDVQEGFDEPPAARVR
jgi:phosphoglycerate dehydrogenase-like enzyme